MLIRLYNLSHVHGTHFHNEGIGQLNVSLT